MVNHRRRRRQAAKLQPKFVGTYLGVEAMPNHTYEIERSEQESIQNEACLKPYWASPDALEEAPPLLEPRRQTTTWDGSVTDQNMRWSCRGTKAWQEMSDRLRQRKCVRHLQRYTWRHHFRNPNRVRKYKTPWGRDFIWRNEWRNDSIRGNGGGTSDVRQEMLPVELGSSPVSAPTSLGRGQRNRQLPAYLKDYICDCIQSGMHQSLVTQTAGGTPVGCESWGPHEKPIVTYRNHIARSFPMLMQSRVDVPVVANNNHSLNSKWLLIPDWGVS